MSENLPGPAILQRAFADGKLAGILYRSGKSPYPNESPWEALHERWNAGYVEGCAERVAAEEADRADAARFASRLGQ